MEVIRKSKSYGILLIVLLIVLYGKSVNVSANAIDIQAPQSLKAVKSSKTSIRLTWKGNGEVDQYQIFRYNKKSRKYQKIYSLKNKKKAAKITWVDKKLKPNKTYKYRVATCKTVENKIYTSDFSYWVSARTYKKNARKVNSGIPRISKKVVYLNQCSAKKVKCIIKASKYGTNKKKEVLSKKVRWYSSNISIAKVDGTGKITAGKNTGKCYIYAKAHNGVTSKVKVNVKNYARPTEYYNIPEENDILILLTDYKREIQKIAEYCQQNRITGNKLVTISLEKDLSIAIKGGNFDIAPIKKEVENLLIHFPYYINIEIGPGSVRFITTKSQDDEALPGIVHYSFDNTWNKLYDTQIASHWIAYRFRPI